MKKDLVPAGKKGGCFTYVVPLQKKPLKIEELLT